MLGNVNGLSEAQLFDCHRRMKTILSFSSNLINTTVRYYNFNITIFSEAALYQSVSAICKLTLTEHSIIIIILINIVLLHLLCTIIVSLYYSRPIIVKKWSQI